MSSSKPPKGGIKEKLKTFFGSSKDASAESSGRRSSSGARRRTISACINSSILKSISPNSDTSSRLKCLKQLETVVSTKLLEDGAVDNLWLCIQDLAQSTDLVQRQAGVEFMVALCNGQASRMGLCRPMFFEYLKVVITSNDSETGKLMDTYTALLKALCNNGEDVCDFEDEIGPFAVAMIYAYLRGGTNATDFLLVLQSLIRNHAAYLDETVLRDIVRYVCVAMCRTKSENDESLAEIIACMDVLDAILRYCCWPKGVLLVVVTALCKLVNVKSLCEHCCLFMRHLLASHSGHGTVYTMCSLMQAAEMYPDEDVLCGAVFFVGTYLWGSKRVETLRHTPGAVLPFILQSLSSNSVTVAYEVAPSMERLIQFGSDLQLLTWDLILKILDRIFDVASSNQLPPASAVAKISHESLTLIEKLHESHSFNGSAEQLFNLIEKVAKHRPEGSILRLMVYRTQSLSPSRGNWLSQLHALLDTYYNRDSRPNIRIEAVRILRNLFIEHRHLHGDELVEVVVLAVFSEVDHEKDIDVQASVISLLVDMAKTSAQNCFYELLAVLERIVNGRLVTMDLAGMNRHDLSQMFVNIECALGGLIEIAKAKWSSTPATEALHVLDLITSHLLLQYSRGICDELGSSARWTALKFLLSLGAEIGTQKLLYKNGLNGQAVASAYIICVDSDQDCSPPPSPISANATTAGRVINFCAKQIIKAFSSCIQKERQWSVLRLLLAEMPSYLLSRRLALSDVDSVAAICLAAIELGTDPKSVLPITQLQDNLTMDEVKEHVYALLTSLIPYRSYFDHNLQRTLADTIQRGVVNHKSGFAVISTINCLFEMPDIMAPTVPDLVRRLSELPPTPTVAIPVVELLSTLMRMHDLYKQFTVDDYENVMGTLTSYVDPFMLTDYIVAVAYQVIFRWFLRAPLMIRPRLAQYALNRIAEIVKKNTDNKEKSLDDPLLRKAYEDAREVCIIFFGIYSFTDEPPSFERSPIAQQLFDTNRARYWIIGDRIFSITQSGKADGCRNCIQKDANEETAEISAPAERKDQQEFLDKRRRHASAIQRRVTGAPPAKRRGAADDTCITSSVQSASDSSLVTKKERARVDGSCSGPCFCWCQEWIELTARHSFGRQAWVVRVGSGTNLTVVDTMAFLGSLGEVRDQETMESNLAERLFWESSEEEGEEEGGRGGEEGGGEKEEEAKYGTTTNLASLGCVNDDDSDSKDGKGKSLVTIPDDDSEDKNAKPDEARNLDVEEIRTVDEAKNMEMDEARDTETNETKNTETDEVKKPERLVKKPDVEEARTVGVDETQEVEADVDVSNKTEVDEIKRKVQVKRRPKPLGHGSNLLERHTTAQDQSKPLIIQSKELFQHSNRSGLFFPLDIRSLILQLFSANIQKDASNDESSILPLPETDAVERAIKNLDRISPYETHKIGVIYIGVRQTTEVEILNNQFGSPRYDAFLNGLGQLINLRETDASKTYVGGLDTNGKDGEFMYHWSDQTSQVIFHVATRMPNRENDPNCQQKKAHIGNDFVTIVFNESGTDYKLSTISGQFARVAIIVQPLDERILHIKLVAKNEIAGWLAMKEAAMSDDLAPLLCRQMAIRADASARIWEQKKSTPSGEPVLCRTAERLRQIKSIKERFSGKALTITTMFD